MKKTKVLFAVWAVIVLVIVALLTTLGFMLKNIQEDYRVLEEKMLEGASEYAHKYALLSESDEMVVTSDELIELGYLDSLELEDDVCVGYVVIHINDTYQYDVYITCNEYTTRGYQEQ